MEFKIDDRVKHFRYGEGYIDYIEGEVIMVDFDNPDGLLEYNRVECRPWHLDVIN